MRPHHALRFGSEVYTPAMMAKIADHKITWGEVLQLCLAAIAEFLVEYSNNVDDCLEIAASWQDSTLNDRSTTDHSLTTLCKASATTTLNSTSW